MSEAKHIAVLEKVEANEALNRASHRIPSHRKASANRYHSDPQTVPHADFCHKHRSRKVAILVLSHETPQGQESKWRDSQSE